MKQEQIKAIVELPIKIKEKEQNYLDITIKLQDMELQNKILEKNTYSDVENEKDENDKPKYSNAQKRQFETDLRLQHSQIYSDKEKRIKLCKENLDNIKIELGYLKRMFRAYESLSRCE